MIMLLCLAACGEKAEQPTPTDDKTGQETQTDTETTVSLPTPNGVDSVKSLLEISLDYFHSGCDYKKIEKYHDPCAYLAYFFMEDFYDDRDMTLDQAMEKAALIYGSADELQAKDPELAALVMEEMDAEDPEEALSEYMNELRDAFRNGEITKDDPNYDRLSQMLTDWDKGADYIFEHYPELLEDAKNRGVAFGLEGAMEQMRRMARFELYRSAEQDNIFKDLECEYRPENTYVNDDGICSYDMGTVIDGYDAWYVDMLYYVKDNLYYLIGYGYTVGGVGG